MKTKLKKAQEVLEKEYEIAKTLEYIKDPLAWALYETWNIFDRTDPTGTSEEE